MQKIYSASEKLFFNILIICVVSFIYFITIPINTNTLNLGLVFSIFYFGVNFYIGYRYNLNFLESLIVGTVGCGVGLFLSFFALYSQTILHMPHFATWLMAPYFLPTLSIVKIFTIPVTVEYSFILMLINVLLVIIGSFSKIIMYKFFTIFK